ncbi:hypothetical protein Verru16b_03190 [Lacunisphaera limnophila]|uniref:Uncharacterized protein n=1 Tax=Lacunisphaera limnophila TaxID=1838286 RepID=A0A1D8AZ12_9BACT|nr:protein DpdD [Lacunisphaera limnophila]AOS46094.1 hypothetical protein Verru16b_03190 [Lacunisphaera limnophila]
MNLAQWSEEDLQALRAFYDAGQAITWADVDTGTSLLLQDVRDWLETSPPPKRYPLVLPACPVSIGEPCWIAIAFSSSQTEQLRREMNAFVGMAGTDFTGHRAVSDPTDRLMRAATRWAGGEFVFRFSVLPGSRTAVRAALDRLRQIWRMRPDLGTGAFRTSDALLREFTGALAAHDAPGSEQWLQAIRQSGRLSAENLRFLEIERLGSLGYWDQLALHPQLSLLITIRRPRRITAWLVEALWRSEFLRYLDADQPDAALAHMRNDFIKRHEPLFRTRAGLTAPNVVLAFVVAAAAAIPPRHEQLPSLLAALPAGTRERAFADRIVATVTAVPATGEASLADAKRILLAEDYDTAWLHLVRLSPSVEVVQTYFDCASELDTPESAQTALVVFNSLSAADQERILRQRRYFRQHEHLTKAVTGGQLVRNWEEWLEKLEADPAWSQAVETARTGAADWRFEDYRDDPARIVTLASRLQAISAASPANVRLALPSIAAFFLRADEPTPTHAPLWECVLFMLAVDKQFGGADWALTQALTAAIFEAGPTAATYAETVEMLRTIWDTRGEPARLDWALDHLDALASAAVLDATAREAFFHSVQRTFATSARRVSPAQRELFRLLCADLGHLDDFAALPAPPSSAGDPVSGGALPSMRDKIVGIYTLTVSAAARAKLIIEQQFPGVDVRLNHEHVGGPRLAALAREADYFLVVAKSAKHAATDYIKLRRPETKPDLIYPSGRGASSIVSALLQALESTA